MADKKNTDIIDLRLVAKKILGRKKLFIKVLAIVFVVSCALILCVPRYYTTDIRLAPEMENQTSGGALSSIASSFGIDLSNGQYSDAINPMLYPDLMDDNGFVSKLFTIHVVSQDGTIDTDYFTYLKKYQKRAWWTVLRSKIFSLFSKKVQPTGGRGSAEYDPYRMSRYDESVAGVIRKKITFGVDKKTGVITIGVTAQDPLICKTVADSVRQHLQTYITDYRTNKARVDLEYYERMTAAALAEYDAARQAYATYADANTNAVLNKVLATIGDLENDMQQKYNTYTVYNTQMQAAKAKVQERTPAFTLLKGASVPNRAAGPKRMIFVLAMMFFAFMGTCVYILKDDLVKAIKQGE